MKIGSSKSRKINIFPKGLTHGFGPKNEHVFRTFFLLRQYTSRKYVFYDILEQKKRPCQGYKNKKFKKSKNSTFLQSG